MSNTPTTNSAFQKPAKGDPLWHTYNNANWDAADAILATLISGLTLSTAGNSGTFGIAVGASSNMALTSACTKTTGAWAVGSTFGSLDTGVIANSTWYHVWLIKRVDTGIVDVLLSLSPTAPTMPASYTLKRRIGSMLTDTSAHWVAFIQRGDLFHWVTQVQDIDFEGAFPSTMINITCRVPTGVVVMAKIRGFIQANNSLAPVQGLLTAKLDASTTPLTPSGNGNISSSAGESFFDVAVLTDTLAQIKGCADVVSNDTYLRAITYAWIDFRGKDA